MSSTRSSVRRLACVTGHFHQPAASFCSGSPAISEKVFAKGSALPPLTPGRLRLYSMRLCPWAQRTRLVLAHKNIPYETVNVHLAKKPKWFWERNPVGLVPVLERDGMVLCESSATCMWLDDAFPENRLQSSDPYIRAWDRVLEEYYGRLASSLYGLLKPDESETALKQVHKCYAYYEDVLVKRGGPFFGGSKPSLIDYMVWPHMERIPAVSEKWAPAAALDKARYPKLDAWYRSMYQLPAVKDTMFDHETHRQFLISLREKTYNYDIGL
ncbi:glutathione S-transferase omega-1 [Aplysia californica]|uniref:Glutathione S-transferase omega n=1 Tax=Aplysia californica TaxID=6500 RepID=A0ABM0JWI2_APLCA|nr:glutathione S-transferase omega-1 [Aplysia californica]XP_005103171.1 glutathione S-transferase omega-1 [Aplysia californica]XP_035826902.1 glutathione S-transferase omega-1 [Aplysia californica]